MELEPIRKYYSPIQPAVKSDQKDIIYQEIPPASPLKDSIYCYWQLKTAQTLDTPYVYRVVSDGCIDIFFNLNKPDESFVMGFYRKYTEFSIGEAFNFVGIRFFPSVFTQIFGIPANSLSNKDQYLASVLPEVAAFIVQNASQELSITLAKLNKLFISLANKNKFKIDSRFYDALLLLLKHHGHIETENGLNTGLSPRQLRRLFNYYIGTTPKAFSQVVRFQYILNAKPSKQSLKENRIFYDVGFYDQAHFIKSFKRFYGVTPSEAFQ